MHISGTEPSSVILSQIVILKSLKWPKNAEETWSQKGWCNKPTKLQFQSILNTENVGALQTLRINRSTVELGYMSPLGLTGPTAVILTK